MYIDATLMILNDAQLKALLKLSRINKNILGTRVHFLNYIILVTTFA